MGKLFKIEMIKMKKSMAFKIILIVLAVTVLMNIGIYAALKYMSDGGMSGLMGLMGIDVSGYGTFLMYLSATDDILMFVIITICIFIGSDFSAKTLQAEISAGYSRNSILTSRFFLTVVLFFIYGTIYIVLNTVAMSILFGFGRSFGIVLLLQMIGRFLLSALTNIALLTCVWLVCFLTKKTGISMVVSLAFFLFGVSIINLIAMSFDTAKKIIDWTPIGANTVAGMLKLEAMDITRAIVSSVVTIGLAALINVLTFNRAELK